MQTGHLDKTVLLVPPVDPDEVELRLKFFADTLALAGVDPQSVEVDPIGLVVVKVGHADQPAVAYCADRRDEATYRAAVAAVLA